MVMISDACRPQTRPDRGDNATRPAAGGFGGQWATPLTGQVTG
jgi:hypothetical protein